MNLFQSVTNALDIALAADSSAGKKFIYFFKWKVDRVLLFCRNKIFLYGMAIFRINISVFFLILN